MRKILIYIFAFAFLTGLEKVAALLLASLRVCRLLVGAEGRLRLCRAAFNEVHLFQLGVRRLLNLGRNSRNDGLERLLLLFAITVFITLIPWHLDLLQLGRRHAIRVAQLELVDRYLVGIDEVLWVVDLLRFEDLSLIHI